MSQPDARRLGALVRAARMVVGLQQKELGQRCGVSASQVSRWETGRSPLYDTRVLWTLAKALDLPPAVLGLADPDEHPVRPAPAGGQVDPAGSSGAGSDDAAHRRAAAPGRGRGSRRAPDPPRRRWSLRARDFQHRTAYVVTTVDPGSGTVTLHMRGAVAVLDPSDVRRLQHDLADALACVFADGGEW